LPMPPMFLVYYLTKELFNRSLGYQSHWELCSDCMNALSQGTLTEWKGSVQLTSSLR
jgi:hypothetical protein